MDRHKKKWYKAEGKMLDDLYRERMADWQKLYDKYELNFQGKVRDLEAEDVVRVNRFYPIVRQILGTIAHNYPVQKFSVEDETASPTAEILERTAAAWMNVVDLKPHVHQAIFDALFCGVGWIRLDYNPPGDKDIIAPYTTNDSFADDMVVASRVPPGYVQLDPTGSPHMLGDKRYIREKFWTPMQFLLDDPTIQNKKNIKPTPMGKEDEVGYGEIAGAQYDSPQHQALRRSVENGDFVLVERWHNRIEKREVMFISGMDEPIKDVPHPFRKMSFPQVMDSLNQPVFDLDEETGELSEPVLDIDNGEDAQGWLVQQGFPFIPIKFDLSSEDFYPPGHLKYIEPIQDAIIEQVSRISDMLKRTSRLTAVQNSELEQNPEIGEKLRTGRDGEHVGLEDINNVRELSWGSVPPDVYNYFNLMMGIEREIASLSPPTAGSSNTATEAAVVAASAQVNGNWMEAAVNKFYENATRGAFQIMGDPRFEPGNFVQNVAPDGENRVLRALRTADFLWNYRIDTRVGSTQPLYAELEKDRTMGWVAYAAQRENYDQLEVDKLAAQANGINDIDKIMKDDDNVEAERAAQYENDRLFNGEPIEVLPGTDHGAHIPVHQKFKEHPKYQELQQQSQAMRPDGQPSSPQAAQQLQAIAQKMQEHLESHGQQAQADAGGNAGAPGGGGRAPAAQAANNADSLISQVASNAQETSDAVQSDAMKTGAGY